MTFARLMLRVRKALGLPARNLQEALEYLRFDLRAYGFPETAASDIEQEIYKRAFEVYMQEGARRRGKDQVRS